jgi:mannose-6-phosphate isomerase-like protein (cupin superfamily)
MSDNPMPRPNFSEPTRIPSGAGHHFLWGDRTAGQVSVETLVWTEQLNCGLFSLPVNTWFGHSEAFPTVTAADEVWITLSGVYLMNCPMTGEVHRMRPGDGVLSRPGTWHHGFSIGDEPLVMLEFLGGIGSGQRDILDFAATVEWPSTPKRTRDQFLGRWPDARSEAQSADRLRVVRSEDAMLRIEGDEHPLLVEILTSTPRLTVGRIELLAGHRSDRRKHGGDIHIYVVSGTTHIHLPEFVGERWHPLSPGDSFFIPEGVEYQLFNETSGRSEILFGVAPAYRYGA